jgi:FtsZ-binding cell division protein ZapB
MSFKEKYLKYKNKYLELKGGSTKIITSSTKGKKLIITTGDISDIDGMFAVAKYIRSGHDVLFIMNFPAYLKYSDDAIDEDSNPAIKPGLGYIYSAYDMLESREPENPPHLSKKLKLECNKYYLLNKDKECDLPVNNKYDNIYKYVMSPVTEGIPGGIPESYRNTKINLSNNNHKNSINNQVINVFNNITINMLKNIYSNINDIKKGSLYYSCKFSKNYDYYFNSINPFYWNTTKNEMSVYSNVCTFKKDNNNNVDYDNVDNVDNIIIAENNQLLNTLNLFTLTNIINTDTDIYIDFNGSMGFFNDKWYNLLTTVRNKIKGVVIMGGICGNKEAQTKGPSQKNLNRFSCSTMNQLYHPPNTKRFFDFLSGENSIEKQIDNVYIVVNNQVEKLKGYEDTKFLTDTLPKFLTDNDIYSEILLEYAKMYYSQGELPKYKYKKNDRKPFDLYSAFLLCKLINKNSTDEFKEKTNTLYYDSTYGITLVVPLNDKNLLLEFITTKIIETCESIIKLPLITINANNKPKKYEIKKILDLIIDLNKKISNIITNHEIKYNEILFGTLEEVSKTFNTLKEESDNLKEESDNLKEESDNLKEESYNLKEVTNEFLKSNNGIFNTLNNLIIEKNTITTINEKNDFNKLLVKTVTFKKLIEQNIIEFELDNNKITT